ncbi:MAG: DNA repair exonuclease [Gemmatimonadota bacterium]|nr:DNA repair exonuclease [Gemmatimonadota bacterium]
MRLVHLSDFHLGFRQFQRVTPTGKNQREADVAQSFTRAIDKVIALAPDLVLIGGDVFHTVRPTNPAILHAFRQFSRLRAALPEAIVVIVAGNHDMPRSSETTCILRLFEPLNFFIIDAEPRRLHFPERSLSILAVPDLPPGSVDLSPDEQVTHNVLLLHGEVEGVLPEGVREDERASMPIPASAVAHPRWDYVALGHYHVYRKVGPNAYYCGSLDYTSTNAWGEYAEERAAKLPGKGMIERDLATGRQTFHPLPVTRKIVDLPALAGRGLSAPDLDEAIAAAVERCPDGGIDGKVVRLVARDVPRHVARELDHQRLREYQRRALHFVLDTRRPAVVRTASAESGAPGRRPSLADTLREALRSRVLTGDIDRDRLVALGEHYLREAEQDMTSRGIGEAADA